LTTICFISLGTNAFCQAYFANGDAKSLGGECYELTPAVNWKLGSVWYADQIDISKDFDLEFYLNFGTKDNGADGIVFVLQTVGNKAIGNPGGGLGFEGFSPSLGIEFDTYFNADMNDIANDHIAIQKNGSVKHSGVNNITTPISALTGGGNIEDGKEHLVRIVWNAQTKNIVVYFDCEQRVSSIIDIQNDIFNGEKLVYWGFSASTGGLNNKQTACLRDDILLKDSYSICKGESALLNARESKNNSYTWTPSLYLDDPSVRTPKCSSVIPIKYYVTYTDLCKNELVDTVEIEIDLPFEMDEANDTLLCDGAKYFFDLRNKYDSVYWGGGNSEKRTYWDMDGYYELRVWKGVCYDDDSFNIVTNVSPTISILGEDIFCDGDSTLLSLEITPNDAAYTWDDGSKSASRYFSDSDAGSIEVSNTCATITENYAVTKLVIDDLSLGKDTVICEGDTLSIGQDLDGSYTYLWNNGSVQSTIDIEDEGLYWVDIELQNLCSTSDTILVTKLLKPELGSLQDILLCENESIELTVENKYGTVVWNNTTEGGSYLLRNYEGPLSVRSQNVCGGDSTSFLVTLQNCYCDIEYPTAFTPNNDILNETLNPYVNCPKLTSFNIQIYNRWGEKLFESDELNTSWDGSFNGSPVQNGVYFWVADWTGIEKGTNQRKASKGNFQLLR